jgi:hypothetical protein
VRDSKPRCLPLGATPDAAGFNAVNMQTLWPPDRLTTDPTKFYSGHAYHSAQFRFTNAQMKNYWTTLMDEFKLHPNQ